MTSLDLETVEEQLLKVTTFLKPCLPLANAHATDFITQHYWNRFLPKSIQDELMRLTREELSSLPSNVVTCSLEQCSGQSTEQRRHERLGPDLGVDKEKGEAGVLESCLSCHGNNEMHNQCKQIDITSYDNGKWVNSAHYVDTAYKDKLQYKSISSFCSVAASCTLERLGLAVTPDELLGQFDASQNELFIGTFMSEKKSHEVEFMSKVCSSIVKGTECKLVIDFGSGKGYLGKHLSLQYHIPVLGIDSVDRNTQSADQRSYILDKQWQALTRNAANELSGKKLSKKERKLTKIKNANKVDGIKNSLLFDANISAKRNTSNDLSNEIKESKSESTSDNKKDGKVLNATKGDNLTKKSDTELCTFATCTCYIDSDTDFMELAVRKFTYLFTSVSSDTKHHENDGNNDLGICNKNSKYKIEDKSGFDDSNCLSCHHGNTTKKPSCTEFDEIDNTSCDRNYGKSESEMSIHSEGQPSADWSHCSDVQPPSMESLSLTSDLSNTRESPLMNSLTLNSGPSNSAQSPSMGSLASDISNSAEPPSNECLTLNPDLSNTTEPISLESLTLNSDLSNTAKVKSDRIRTMLVGLHTCGDLASTSVKLFTRNNQLNVLCNVGCCYNLITEKYLGEMDDGTTVSDVGFPLSRCLNQLEFCIGNTARNLACQSVYRVPQFEQLQGERFYPRALLEVIIQDFGSDVAVNKKGLRGLEKKCKSIKEYLKKACDKINISESDKITDAILDDYLSKYKDERQQLAAFFQLKTILAPCIETLIVLDRVAFLLEQSDVKEVYIVKMFDPVISPRCYAIVGIKS